MADRTIKLRVLLAILRRYEVHILPGRGKGSHLVLAKRIENGLVTFALPSEVDIPQVYVKKIRRKYRLTVADGVTDKEFYDS